MWICVCVCEREMLRSVYSRDTHFCNLSVCCSIPTLRRIRKSSWHKTLAWQYFKSTTGELVHLSPLFSAGPPTTRVPSLDFPRFISIFAPSALALEFSASGISKFILYSRPNDGCISVGVMHEMNERCGAAVVDKTKRSACNCSLRALAAAVPETICSRAKMDIFLSLAPRRECVCINSRRSRARE